MKYGSDWIKQNLPSARGSKARLAEAMDITPAKLSKAMNGTRSLTPEEVERAKSFFGMAAVISPEDQNLLDRASRLSPQARQQLGSYIDGLLDAQDNCTRLGGHKAS